MNISQAFKNLPAAVKYDGIWFEPVLFRDGDEIRFCYKIFSVTDSSQGFKLYNETGSWKNPFINDQPYLCDFLWLYENIESDTELEEVLKECLQFLIDKKLI